jgi:hypothetical protein
MEPTKASNDVNRQYRFIELGNEIAVTLVSDPTVKMGAAALDVAIGSFNDPEDLQGLAHFLGTFKLGLEIVLLSVDCCYTSTVGIKDDLKSVHIFLSLFCFSSSIFLSLIPLSRLTQSICCSWEVPNTPRRTPTRDF